VKAARAPIPAPEMPTMRRLGDAVEISDRIFETPDPSPVFPGVGEGISADVVTDVDSVSRNEDSAEPFAGIVGEVDELGPVRVCVRIVHRAFVNLHHTQVRHEPTAFVSQHQRFQMRSLSTDLWPASAPWRAMRSWRRP
jgi:hypothetical protein